MNVSPLLLERLKGVQRKMSDAVQINNKNLTSHSSNVINSINNLSRQ